jgi:uncharacterized Zn finger protein (UPF0148 family)
MNDTVKVACPRCGSPDARQWRGRVACGQCGLLWVPYYAAPPMDAQERYWVRRRPDEDIDH